MVEKLCEHCDKPFNVRPYQAEKARFCSNACRGAWQKEQEKRPSKRTKVAFSCAHCGNPFLAPPSRSKHGRALHCSKECQTAAVAAALDKKVTCRCTGCGGEIRLPPSKAARSKTHYCSRECRDTNRVGPKHPQYKGGDPNYRGPNWQAQKRKAKRRDKDTCQKCDGPGEDVHHKRPFRLFTDYVEANDLSNLETLCKPCHRREDARLQASENLTSP